MTTLSDPFRFPHSVRLLIADDEPAFRQMLHDLLAIVGFRDVTEAEDAFQALQLMTQIRPDVILMDIEMPGMDGITAVREIKNMLPTPVIMLSAYESPELVRQAAEAGATACLVKPPTLHELARAITLALRKADIPSKGPPSTATAETSAPNSLAQEKVVESETVYQNMVESIPVVVYIDDINSDSSAIYMSPQAELMFGYTQEEWLTVPDLWLKILHPEDRGRVEAENERTNRTGEPFRMEYRIVRKDGRVVWVLDTAVLILNAQGKPLEWRGIMIDISDRKQVEQALARREAILESITFMAMKFLRDPSWEADILQVLGRLGEAAEVSRVILERVHQLEDGSILSTELSEWNAPGIPSLSDDPLAKDFPYVGSGFERWERLLGNRQMIAGNTREFPASEQAILVEHGVRSILVAPIFVGGRWWGNLGFDECLQERTWSAAEKDALLTATSILAAAIERKEAEENLRYLSTHDTLTGLYNRAYFEIETQRLEHSRLYPISVIMMDVDDFKAVNDTLGHIGGDEYLKHIVQILLSVFRKEDIVARMGGDEFAVLLPETDKTTAREAVERVQSALVEQSRLTKLPLRLSLGCATKEQPGPLSDVIKLADDRMYEEKISRRQKR